MNKYYYIIGAVIVVVIGIALQQNSQPRACTEEAKLCPDGSAVGRVAPNCDFAPCPSCKCPEGFMPATAGNYCVAKCKPYQECPAIAVACQNTIGNKTTDELCIASGGTVTTQLCCQSSGDFPNTCLIGACGCSPDNSKEVKVCDCGEGKCWNGYECVAS